VDTTNTGIPTGVTAANSGYNSINISWSIVTGASGYEIYRSTSNMGTYTIISGPVATKYNNTGLITNTTYYYKVRAYTIINNIKVFSAYSNEVSAKPILATPINFKATLFSSRSIKLTWSGVTGSTAYEIYRAISSTGSYSLLTRTSYLYYTNTDLIKGKTYYYKIRSFRTIGNIKVYSNWTISAYKTITNIVFNILVQPNVVYGQYAGLKVEIIDQNENTYLIQKTNGTQMWVASNNISIPSNPVTNTKYLDKKQLETYVNVTSSFVSNTKYFTWVDLNRQRVNVFIGSTGHWVLLKTYSCASGNNVTPSKRGLFTVQDKGYSFVTESKLLVKYWTQYSGDYLLHSILLTASGNVYDGMVGKRASHGCIRMPLDMAKWYFETIPKGSLIWVN
jgi:lipoprotein-anchoring transpeptidase ErfK/SrfK